MGEKDLAIFDEIDRDIEYGATHDMWPPDSALDMIWMLNEADWMHLDKVWQEKSVAWKLICTFLLGHGPGDPGQTFLKRALLDNDLNIVREAASSLSLFLERDAEEIVLNDDLINLLNQTIERGGESMLEQTTIQEIKHLLQLIRNA